MTETDREKIIKGLECCSEKGFCTGDLNCPYWNDSSTLHFDDCKQLIHDTLALLKEQEPVKPRSVTKHGANPQVQHFCGKCNATLFRHKQKFCIECGTPVKWK